MRGRGQSRFWIQKWVGLLPKARMREQKIYFCIPDVFPFYRASTAVVSLVLIIHNRNLEAQTKIITSFHWRVEAVASYITYNSTSSTAILSSSSAALLRHSLSSRSSVVVCPSVLVKYGGLRKEQQLLEE